MSLSGITPEYLVFIEHEEGVRLAPYLDPVGFPTIGIGHRVASMDTPPLADLAAARALLAEDLVKYRANALALSPGLADEPEIRLSAVLDFCYNAGSTNYATSTLRKRVNAKTWPDAAKEMRRWVYATDQTTRLKVKLNGLVRRRNITANWLELGK